MNRIWIKQEMHRKRCDFGDLKVISTIFASQCKEATKSCTWQSQNLLFQVYGDFMTHKKKNILSDENFFGGDSSDLKWVILHHYKLEVKYNKPD